jgi:uncharacterized protein YecE (DUF72 family)
MSEILIGVAGWDYPDWNGIVYVSGETRDKLASITRFVDVVEINATFYRPNTPSVAESWVQRTCFKERFSFTAKSHRSWTHGDEEPWIEPCLEGLRPIRAANRLAAVLVQFPQSFRPTDKAWRRLDRLAAKAHGWPLVVEVRHRSWQDEKIRDRFKNLGLGWCVVDQPLAGGSTLPPTPVVTGPIAYLRMHGRNEADWFRQGAGRDNRYNYLYSESEVAELAVGARVLAETAEQVIVIQNNHYKGKALANALQMKHALTGEKPEAPAGLVEAYPGLETLCRSIRERLF